ncbi:unnamed protein product [Urochloa humidicola]
MARGPTPTSRVVSAAVALVVVGVLCSSVTAEAEAGGNTMVQPAAAASGLSLDFYKKSCPNAESIVRGFVRDAVRRDAGLAAGLLRLHFHDCFIQGCDASILLDSTPKGQTERDAIPNKTLRREAITAINAIRDRLDRACGGAVVSCADILTLAARDAVVESGGPRYMVPLGRRDSDAPAKDLVNTGLPRPDSHVPTMLELISKGNLGLDATDLVALSGAHTIGLAHCTSFESRLFPQTDATMDAAFAARLKQTCPAFRVNRTAVLDARTPNVFDNNYFVNLVSRQGVLTSDQDLFTNATTRPLVQRFAADQRAFFHQFKLSMLKMGQIKVLTGNQGQVRRNCSKPNNLMMHATTDAGLPWSTVGEAAAESHML